MKINEIIDELENYPNKGFQLTKRKGMLTSTWLIYKKGDFYYYFDINEKIEFIKKYKYSKEEILNELEHSSFMIEEIID
ncbi:hypothetical protein FSS13T_27070 [Flavobacterium saliperosum S13]|uniref:Uncharacterized protein n=2 Tax=Flavobacterium saliperosum TaxID=329186 RepID=A0A1G4W5A1_9FLAO|nr:hypothetical protein [Flavobacterium saliperosum]ESU21549.1 hypothetical protein FSS13T_27070 [Flavobacterium saliperosum S13]SCX16973.1 hypothetical protein SAMN02927925_02463 [Flavobacterium saliperosum]